MNKVLPQPSSLVRIMDMKNTITKKRMNMSIFKEQRRFNIGDDVLTGYKEWAKFGREELRYKSQQWKSVRLRERHLAGEENKENKQWLIFRNQDFGPELWWTYHFFHCCKFERHSYVFIKQTFSGRPFLEGRETISFIIKNTPFFSSSSQLWKWNKKQMLYWC